MQSPPPHDEGLVDGSACTEQQQEEEDAPMLSSTVRPELPQPQTRRLQSSSGIDGQPTPLPPVRVDSNESIQDTETVSTAGFVNLSAAMDDAVEEMVVQGGDASSDVSSLSSNDASSVGVMDRADEANMSHMSIWDMKNAIAAANTTALSAAAVAGPTTSCNSAIGTIETTAPTRPLTAEYTDIGLDCGLQREGQAAAAAAHATTDETSPISPLSGLVDEKHADDSLPLHLAHDEDDLALPTARAILEQPSTTLRDASMESTSNDSGAAATANVWLEQERARFRQQVRDSIAAEMSVAEATPHSLLPHLERSEEQPLSQGSTKLQDWRPKGQRRNILLVALALVAVVAITFVLLAGSKDSRSSASPSPAAAPMSLSATTSMAPASAPVTAAATVVVLPDGRLALTTTAQLYQAVDDYDAAIQANGTADGSMVALQYGYPMGIWDVSRLTDFSRVFNVERSQALDATMRVERMRTMPMPNLSGWNVSRAVTMQAMFAGAENWVQDNEDGDGLQHWDVGLVVDFSYMFHSSTNWVGTGVAHWNTSSAKRMDAMFVGATAFDGDLSLWNVARVEDMTAMFASAESFQGGDLSQWNVARVRSMAYMFGGAFLFNGDVSTWSTTSLESVHSMFEHAASFNGNLSTWSIGKIQNMRSMFRLAHSFAGGDLTAWNTSRVVDMGNMLFEATSFNGSISTWNVSHVQNFQGTFERGYSFQGDISDWDVRSALNMDRMFKGAVLFNGDLSHWDVSNVQSMNEMFLSAKLFNSDVSSWSVARLLDGSKLFKEALVFNQNLCEWKVKLPVAAMVSEMFNHTNCTSPSDPLSSSQGPFCSMCNDSRNNS